MHKPSPNHQHKLMAELCWRSLMILLYWEWHLIPRWLLEASSLCFRSSFSTAWLRASQRLGAVLCMLYKIRCNMMHPLYGALPVPYGPVRVTRGAVISHRYAYAPPRCRTSQYCRIFIALSVSLWNDLVDPVFDGVGLAGFKSRANAYLLA